MNETRIHVGEGRWIGSGRPALIVAEIGQNHNGSLALAEQLVDAAAWAGADAVKFIKRDLDCELSTEARSRVYATRHAFGATYGDHRSALELSIASHRALAERARDRGMLYFATACDIPSARLLESLNVGVFKIASRDLTNLPLLDFVAGRKKPLFVSTGMSSFPEIDAAVAVVRRHAPELVLLQCTSLYPAPAGQMHLRSMQGLADRYSSLVGFSDHSEGGLLPPVAVALGAAVIEKHFTLDRTQKGTDHACSLEPEQLRQMIADIRQVEAALGRSDKPVPAEVAEVRAKLGRSLVTSMPVPAGSRLEEPMLTLKCPGDGLSWSDRGHILGRVAKRSLAANEKLSLKDFV